MYAVARGIRGAAIRPFWLDEFCTLAIADRPNLHNMWTVLAGGFDSAPPLFYLIERLALGLLTKTQIALRLPSIIAFPCTLICVFVYAKKRSGELIGCICALLLLLSSLFYTYLIEARAYSMMIACVAFALVCYQRYMRLQPPFWAVLLGVSLVLAESLHYYAVFAMIPFWIAEGVVLVRTRRLRWPIWIALVCGMLPLVGFWFLLSAYRAYYGSHLVFSRPGLSDLMNIYGSFFLIDNAFVVALSVVTITAIAWLCMLGGDSCQLNAEDENIAEGLLLLTLIALPVFAFVLVRLADAILTSRYVLATTIGLILGIGCLLSMLRPKGVALFALFALFSVGMREMRFWRHPEFSPMGPDSSVKTAGEFVHIEKFVQDGGLLDLPVVFGAGMVYAQIVYYSPPGWTGRLVFLTDEQKELSLAGTDTLARVLAGLRDSMPLRLTDYSNFTAAHNKFLLYSQGGDWVLTSLKHDEAAIQLLEIEPGRQLYLIKMKESSPH